MWRGDAAITAQEEQIASYRDAADEAEAGDLAAAEEAGTAADEQGEAIESTFDDLGLSECGSAAGTDRPHRGTVGGGVVPVRRPDWSRSGVEAKGAPPRRRAVTRAGRGG